MSAKIVEFRGERTSAKAALSEMLAEAKDGDVAIVMLISGDDLHIVTSRFRERDLCWGAQVLSAHASAYIMRD